MAIYILLAYGLLCVLLVSSGLVLACRLPREYFWRRRAILLACAVFAGLAFAVGCELAARLGPFWLWTQ